MTSPWTGRDDPAEGPQAERWHHRVKPLGPGSEPGTTFLGFACDAGVARNLGRVGAAKGPAALRKALANLAVHHEGPIWDAGDVTASGDRLEEAQAELGSAVASLLGGSHFPLVLGGGHEIARGTFLGLRPWLESTHPGERLGILNLDAHFDLRRAERPSSGTPFRENLLEARERELAVDYACLGIARPANTRSLFETARELDVAWIEDFDLQQFGPKTTEWLQAWMARQDHIHLSIDLDVLPAEAMPGVSAPAALGVPLPVIHRTIRHVMKSGKVRLVEFAELNPDLDRDGRSARVAARLVFEIASAMG